MRTSAENLPPIRRRSVLRFLLERTFQLKYAALDLAYVIIAISTIGALGFSRFPEILDAYALAGLTSEAINLKLFAVSGFVLLLVLNCCLTFVFSIVLSHRIAGPIFVFNRTLKAMAEGDYSQRINIRKLDEFRSTGEAINLIADKLERVEKELKS